LHTKKGGIIFYGIDDDGVIIGSDVSRQIFDQKLQNSVRNTISPQPNIEIKDKNVLGSKIIMVVIPPWDKVNLYQYTKTEKFYIRKGTNVFALKPEEIKKLSVGEYVA
jgi:predicted HTH transcriptional regulator